MTAPLKTATDWLVEAQRVLDKPKGNAADTLADLLAVSACLDKATEAIQLSRCEAGSALDKL